MLFVSLLLFLAFFHLFAWISISCSRQKNSSGHVLKLIRTFCLYFKSIAKCSIQFISLTYFFQWHGYKWWITVVFDSVGSSLSTEWCVFNPVMVIKPNNKPNGRWQARNSTWTQSAVDTVFLYRTLFIWIPSWFGCPWWSWSCTCAWERRSV